MGRQDSIVSEAGFSLLVKKFSIKVSQGYLKPWVVLYLTEDTVKGFRNMLIDNEVVYTFDFLKFEILQTELVKLFADKYLEKGRFWHTRDKIFKCNQMSQQQLSNCVNYLEIALSLNKMSASSAEEYLDDLNNSIVLELEERFDSEVLDFFPATKLEKQLFEEYLKLKKSEAK